MENIKMNTITLFFLLIAMAVLKLIAIVVIVVTDVNHTRNYWYKDYMKRKRNK